MTNTFPNKAWSIASVSRVINKIDNDGTTERKPGSGRPKSARTQQKIERVSELICSQDDDPHSHKSPREIERETGIPRSSVRRIIKQDLELKTYKRVIGQKINENVKLKRLQRSQQLLARFPNERSVRTIWFTDEKTFTVSTPVNSQNDRVYSIETKKDKFRKGDLYENVTISAAVSWYQLACLEWGKLVLSSLNQAPK